MAGRNINVVGLILLFIGTFILGCILSALYLALAPLAGAVDIRLSVVLTILFGAGMGFASALMVRFFKVETTIPALVVILIGCLCFTYFKWGLYVARDCDEYLPQTFGWSADLEGFFTDEDTGELLSDIEIRNIVDEMRNVKAIEYWDDEQWELYLGVPVDASIREALQEYTFLEMMDYDVYLGATPSEALKAIHEEFESSYYGYYLDWKGLDYNKMPNGMFYLSHPAVLAQRIASINHEGRWSIGDRGSESDDMVSGVLLFLVWFAEFLFIAVPMMAVAYSKTRTFNHVHYTEPMPYYNAGTQLAPDIDALNSNPLGTPNLPPLGTPNLPNSTQFPSSFATPPQGVSGVEDMGSVGMGSVGVNNAGMGGVNETSSGMQVSEAFNNPASAQSLQQSAFPNPAMNSEPEQDPFDAISLAISDGGNSGISSDMFDPNASGELQFNGASPASGSLDFGDLDQSASSNNNASSNNEASEEKKKSENLDEVSFDDLLM